MFITRDVINLLITVDNSGLDDPAEKAHTMRRSVNQDD